MGRFELYWGESAECCLSSPSVVVAFNLCHDREAELIAGDPAAAVQDVLLQLGEEQLHRCVVSSGRDSTHGTLHPGDSEDHREAI